MFLFPLTCALTAVPSMAEADWIATAPWLILAPVCSVPLADSIEGAPAVSWLAGGELKGRVSELAAKAGRRDVEVYVSSSERSQAWNAFALRRNGIVLTAPLVRSLHKQEVDAVAAHELSHFGHSRRSPFA